ncbi:hypothetical protein G7Z17_g8035 [Cylindrodendrum hubeiense]|uniref:Uncharacterized protein n=1 Tax=Cylindrodendrum hubeiense TaxID=595255 RepID=A0A9P5LF49_9HYPO|nr:hypothetical protein G7Z17_g8035 [Cylindrodendrum hubeiense]
MHSRPSNHTNGTVEDEIAMIALDACDPINVIIPIGGIGSRFAKEGYRFPKPLINIVGRPMLLWLIDNLNIRPQDTLWIAINEDINEEFRIGQLVSKSFPKIDFRLLPLRHQTKGASDKPIYSYIKTQKRKGLERIIQIQEKKAIDNKANTGAYVFPTAAQLKVWAAENLDVKHPEGSAIGEHYTSQIISSMVHSDIPCLGLLIEKKDFSVVGTPEQLEDLLRGLKRETSYVPAKLKARRFCFDLDMTLVGVPAVAGDYSTCPPIEKNIRLVQQLHKAGHYIIITHNGDTGKVFADIGMVTLNQLGEYAIPYHELHLGKPYADVYIDDLAVNANLDTMREIGWMLDEPEASSIPSHGVENVKAGMMAARDFNTVQIIGAKVIKSSKSANILGELFFYSHMPAAIAPLFPAIYSVDYIPSTSTYNITMENRRGRTFSHLLVGRSITKGRLTAFLEGLHSIHTTPSADKPTLEISSPLGERFADHSPKNGHINIYANYGPKLRSRYHQNRDRYDALGPLASTLFARINEFLDTYEAEEKGLHARVIHGDPVFSNAILSNDDRNVTFIDVRCQLRNTLTPEGDIHYDLAKVLQSLCGYDHILFMSANNHDLTGALDNDAPLLDEADTNLLQDLQEQ